LTQLLTAPPEQAPNPQGGFIIGLTKPLLHNQRRVLEQSVVAWEDDAAVSNCPNCAQTFSRFSQPKHHCRICGKVVCGDPRTLCSKEISLDVAPPSEKPGAGVGTVALNIRICTPCTTTLFSKRDFALSLLSPPPSYVRAYATLVSFQTGIGEQLPRFQRMVEGIQRDPGDRDRVMEVVKMKRRIVEALAKVDGVAKTIAGARGVCGGGAGGRGAEGKLRHSIAAATANWGREIGLHVKTAATVLDAVVSSTRPSAKEEIAARLGKKLPPPPPPAPVPALPAAIHVEESPEDVSARETVVVLEEQNFLLLQMMEDAKHRRQFDEVEALGRSLEEIEAEVVALGGGVVGV
jgi:hypothetical protein